MQKWAFGLPRVPQRCACGSCVQSVMLLQKAPTPSSLPDWHGCPQMDPSMGAHESCEVPASVVPPELDELLHPVTARTPRSPMTMFGRGMRGVFPHAASGRNNLRVSIGYCDIGGTTTVLMGATLAPAG